jgi:hypothetical protein
MPIKIYRGDSLPVAKVVNITPILVASGQVFKVTCNGKSEEFTALFGDGPAEVAAGLAAAIQATAIAELQEVTATAGSGILTLTANTPGVPFDATVTSSGNVAIVETTQGKAPVNEQHQIQLTGTYTGGTFTLTYNFGSGNVTTGTIAYNASAATVQSAIAALSGVGAGQVIVTGGPGPSTPWVVQFTGTLAGTVVDAGTVNGGSLTGNGGVTITTTQHGAGLSSAIQLIDLSNATGGSFTLSFGGQTTGAINYGASGSTVQTALQGLSTIGSGNLTIYSFEEEAHGTLNFRSYYAVFSGTLADAAQSAITINTAGLIGSATVDPIQTGGATSCTGWQIVDLNGATNGTFSLTYNGHTTTQISVLNSSGPGAAAAAVFAALNALPSPNVLNVSCSQSFTGIATTQFLVNLGSTTPAAVPVLVINGANLGTGGTGATVTVLSNGCADLNCIQSVVVFGSGGTFALTAGAQTTGMIAWNASTGTVQTAVQTLTSSITACTVTGSGTLASPWQVTITSPAITDVATMTGNGSLLTGGGGTITELAHGAAGVNEVQTATTDAGVSGGTFTLAFKGQVTGAIAYNASAATVQSALTGLSTINTVTVAGSAGGPWTVTFSSAEAASPEPLLVGDGSLLTGATTSLITLSTMTWSAGQNHYDDPTNWQPVGVPGAGDSIYFSQGDVDCLYGLDQIAAFTANASTDLCTWTTKSDLQTGQAVYLTSTTTLPAGLSGSTLYYLIGVDRDAQTFKLSTSLGGSAVNITDAGTGTHTVGARPSYIEFSSAETGATGLPFANVNGEYIEYRQRFLHIGLATVANGGTQKITIGTGDGSGSGKIQLNTDVDVVALKLLNSGGSSESGIPAVLWKGTNPASTVEVVNADFGSCLVPGETATLASLTERAGSVHLGPGLTLDGPLDKTGGSIIIDGSTINGVVYAR